MDEFIKNAHYALSQSPQSPQSPPTMNASPDPSGSLRIGVVDVKDISLRPEMMITKLFRDEHPIPRR